MRSNPPRRSRPPSEGGGIPFVPLFLGVIVLGFVIGAGLSLARRNANTVAFASPTPVQSLPPVTPAPTEKPTPVPTDAPTETATDAPSEAASSAPSDTPSISASAAVTARATTEPSAKATTTASVISSAEPLASADANAALTKVKAKPSPTAGQAAIAHSTATEAPAQTDAPASTAPQATRTPHSAAAAKSAPAAAAASSAADASSDFPRLAAAVVRQYLVAVSRGDQDSAYAALGGSPGDRGVQLTEAGIVDAHTRIGNVESHGTGDAATVSVDLHTAEGVYYGQYTVHRNDTGAAVIVQHSISK